MQYDVLASTMHTATGQVQDVAGNALTRTRIKGAYYVASVAGSITLRDGGATGSVIATIPLGATTDSISLPGEGLLFRTDVHMTITGATVTGITFFYG